MSKISELGPITGANTRSEDLFVIVNLIQGDDGTKNITRRELVQALQYEIFNRITITGGSISNVTMFASTLSEVEISNSLFDVGNITNSVLDNVVITNAEARDVEMSDSTIANTALDDVTITNAVANNMAITDSDFSDGTGNNVVLTNSQIDNSLYNNVTIEQGTANGLILTNIEIDELVLEDALISNSQIITTSFSNGSIFDVTVTNTAIWDTNISNSEIITTILRDVDIYDSRFSNGQIWDTAIANSTVLNTAIEDSTANNLTVTDSAISDSTGVNLGITGSVFDNGTLDNNIITNSDFSDGTGNNNIFTNTTIDEGTIQNSVIANTAFQGTMNDVVAQNMQITSSSASDLTQTKSSFDGGVITNSAISEGSISNTVIDNTQLVDFDMDLKNVWEPNMDEDSYFAIKNVKTGETEQITYRQLYNEIAKNTEKALKVHVSADGDDNSPGTILKPVRTLKRAAELALEKAGGKYDRNDIENAVHISVGPGTYEIDEPIWLPDDCSMSSTSGQYATLIKKKQGWERTNGILVGSGCYLQGFSYMNFEVDNFDYPEGGFAVAYRPGALLRRSPYIRDSSQLSNFNRLDVEPPLQPFNSKGTIADLGQEIFMEVGHSVEDQWAEGDEVTFSSGAKGFISWATDVDSDSRIFVRNLKGAIEVGDMIYTESGGTGQIKEIGIDDFPNRLVGRGGGCLLADRRVLDPDSLYTYVLCFGFTPRTQNGVGYVARDGAGVNGIGSLSIFVRTAFYALNGGQMTLNNSGTQFGDISMRAKGSTNIFTPPETSATLVANSSFAATLDVNRQEIIEDTINFLQANTANGGLDYQGYDAEKCMRDTGIIVDNVGYDVALNSNYWGRLNGITYRSPISYVVVNEQLTETVGANQYLKSEINRIFQNADPEVNQRVGVSLDETLNVLQNGEPAANPIQFADTGDRARTNARELLQDNRDLIIEGMVDWIDNNDQFFAYDSATCRRDIQEFILPSVKYDMLLDTNYNTITAGRAYYYAQAKPVVEAQRNETVSAYERLRLTTDEVVQANSAIAAARTKEKFDGLIDIIDGKHAHVETLGDGVNPRSEHKFTPTNVTYDPSTGLAVMTIGAHHASEMSVGRTVLLMPESLVFTCASDNNTIEYAHPRKTDPAYKAVLPVIAVGSDSITVNVGSTGYSSEHTFVRAEDGAISVIADSITFSDNAAIDVNKRNARKQLQNNKEFVQDYMMTWADNEWFFYDSAKCQRDTLEYILPAVKRDMTTGTNFNSIQAGIAYKQGISTEVINNQLTETLGAYNHLKAETAALLPAGIPTDRANAAFDEFTHIMQNDNLFTPTDAVYDPVSGDIELTIGAHNIPVGKWISIAPESITLECGSPAQQIVHPRTTDPAYKTPVRVTAVTATSITVNVGNAGGYTEAHTFVSATENCIDTNAIYWTDAARIVDFHVPENATYDPVTGEFVITITGHSLAIGEHIQLKPHSFVMECNGENISHPRIGDFAYDMPLEITAADANTITVNVGAANGYTGAHTFISAESDAVMRVYANTQGAYAAKQLIANRTFIQEEIKAWLASNYFVYNDAKCQRDTGLILDAVQRDVLTGSNVNSVFAGLAYRSGNASTENVVTNQLTETVGALTWLRDEVAGIVSAGGATRSNAAFNEIIDIMNNGIVAADAISFGTTYVSDENLEARQILQANKQFMIDEATAFIAEKFPSLTYDVAKCERDLGYFIDSISWDIQHGSTAATVNNSRLYFDNAVSVLGNNEKVPTAKAYKFLAGLAVEILNAQEVDNRATNVVQDYNGAGTSNTPTNATYDPVTGVMVLTLGAGHGLVKGDYVTIDKLSITLECGSPAQQIVHPRTTDPIYNNPVRVDAADATTITLQVGNANGYTEPHTFVSAATNCVRKATTPVIGEAVRSLFEIVSDLVWGDEFAELPVAIEPNYSANTAGYTTEMIDNAFIISGSKPKYQTEVIDFIRENYNGLAFNQDLCYRDVGYIVDAVAEDIEYGGNDACVNAAHYYFNNALNILPEDQREVTRMTYEYLSTVVEDIVTETAITPTAGNSLTQNTSGMPADATTGIAALDLVEIVAGNSDDISPASIPDPIAPVVMPSRTFARKALQANRDFIQDEVVAYIDSQYFTIQDEKCARDAGYMLEAVKRDVRTNSDYNSRIAGKAYRSGTAGTNSVIEKEIAETIGAIKFLQADIETHLSGTALTVAQRAFDNIIDSMLNDYDASNANYDFGQAQASASHGNATTALQLNRTFLRAEAIAYINVNYPSLTYDNAKCSRDIGYLVDAISYDARHGSNQATRDFANLYFSNGNSVLPVDQQTETAAVFAHIGAVAEQVVLKQAVTKSAGNTETQQFLFNDVLAPEAQAIQDLADIVAAVITANTVDAIPAEVEAQVTSPGATGYDFETEAAIIETRIPVLQANLLPYLSREFAYLEYNKVKCRRDIGYMVDAISHDIQYGGNSAMWNAAQIYFVNAVNLLPFEQREPTKRAFTRLADVVYSIIRNEVVAKSPRNTATQEFKSLVARRRVANEAKDLALMVADIVDDNNPTNLPHRAEPQNTWFSALLQDAKQIIDRAQVELTQNMINFISSEYNGISYDKAKCRRDVGLMIDAVSHDVNYTTNFAMRLAANMYFTYGTSVLPFDQREQTADFYVEMGRVLSDVVQELATNQNTDADPATAVEGGYVKDLVRVVENAIRRDSLDSIPALIKPDVSWVDASLKWAAQEIDNSLDQLADDVTTHLSKTFKVLDYNKAKCYRDGGYLVDAFSFDANYGGNTASRWNAEFYFWNNVFRIPEDQRIPTAQAYRKLGEIARDVVLGCYPGQVIRGDVSTQEVADQVYDLGMIFYNTFLNADVKDLGPVIMPNFEWEDKKAFRFAKDILKDNRSVLQKSVNAFISKEYKFFDINKTARDTNNLITSLINDFEFVNIITGESGGQKGMRSYAQAFFDQNARHVFPVFNPTTQGLKFQKTLETVTDLDNVTGQKINHAYIVSNDWNGNRYSGDIYYWDGSSWVNDGANNVDLLYAFYKSWEHIRDFIKTEYSVAPAEAAMIDGLFNDVLIASVLRPSSLQFGSLVESIAHQFNGASAGVNRTALPINFRNLGLPISAIASVLSEDGGRVRWSGADELNNQYFARGLRINGRTGRIEGRPFTSSVRKLARRASNSRAIV